MFAKFITATSQVTNMKKKERKLKTAWKSSYWLKVDKDPTNHI